MIIFLIIVTSGMQHQGEPIDYDPYIITRYGILGVTIYPPIYYYWYVIYTSYTLMYTSDSLTISCHCFFSNIYRKQQYLFAKH